MAVVTGDRYLDSLVKFVENHAERLIDGSLVLKLNPVGLRYVQSRLEALAELESLLSGAPVDYLRAYVSDLGDHRALEQLRRILRLLPSLKVVSVLPLGRDPTPLYLVPFSRVKVLELRGCDLSTSAAKGLLELRFTLEKLICHNSTDALRHVFASRIADIRDSHQWNRLSFVSCACNSLVLMDESLQLLPVVETLDLSRNKFTTVDNLRKCMKLKHVDLGFNNLRSIASFAEVSCLIVKLVLRNNALTSLHGIENLKSLQGLDLSYNIISNFSQIEILAGLSSLQNLWLDGNPICCSRWFRSQVFSLFSYPEQLKLDDMKISRSEFWKRQVIIASRQKQPSSFGFYFPIQDDADRQGNTTTRRKRISRLVNIEDDEGSTHAYSDQDSPSCDNQSQTKDENTDQEVQIDDLVRRIESLKKDHSVLWLQEFKEWMNQTPEDSVGGNKYRNNVLHESNDMNNRKYEDSAETSRHIFDSFQLSGDDSSTVILESETSFAETSTSAQRYLDQIGDSTSRSFIGLDGEDKNLSKNLKMNQEELSFFSNEGNALVDDGDFNSFVGPKRDATTENTNSTSTVLHDIIGSQSSSFCPGSPPHYQEDLLHRRHNLEEEFLQLSAESFSLASSESNTSCSEDDSAEVGHLVTQFDQSSLGNSFEKSHNSILSDSFCDDVGEAYYDKISLSKLNGTNTSGHGRELDLSAIACGGSFSNALHDDEKLGFIKGKTKGFEMSRHRRKNRRRMISLPEEEDVHSDIDHVDTSRCDIVHGLESCCSRELPESPLARINEDQATPMTLNYRNDDVIETYFNSNVPQSGVDEICRNYVQCSCLFEEGLEYNEREVAVILSSKEKLYITLVDASDGSGPGLNVVGCHRVNDVIRVFVGLGLQIMRVCFEQNTTYLFITRCMERSRELLCLLHIFDSSRMNNMCFITSLEHIQFNPLVEHVCGSSNINIFQYSMVLFHPTEYGDNLWLPKSLFMLDGHLLLCTENFKQFGLTENAASPDYFSQGSCCAISAVSKMVIETEDNLCITLFFERASEFHPSGNVSGIQVASLKKRRGPYLLTWKLKWFSRDGLLNFVALIRALHCQASISPSPVHTAHAP